MRTSRKITILAVYALGQNLLYFHRQVPAVLSGYLTAELKLDAVHLGLLAALSFYAFAVLQVPGGYLVDRLGPRRVVTSSFLVMTAGAVIFALAVNYPAAFIGRALIGVGSALIFLPALKSLGAWFAAGQFATAQGLLVLAGNVGSVAATTPLAWSAELFGWRPTVATLAVISLAAALLSHTLLEDNPGQPSASRLWKETKGLAPGVGPAVSPGHSLTAGLCYALHSPHLRISWVILFASFGPFLAFQGLWAGPLVRDVAGLGVIATGNTLLILAIGQAIGTPLIGVLSDRVLRRRQSLIVVCMYLQAFIWAVLVVLTPIIPVWGFQALFFVLGLLIGGTILLQVVTKELTPPHLFGTVFGVINSATFVGAATFQVIVGWILASLNRGFFSPGPASTARAYSVALAPIALGLLVAARLAASLPETYGRGEDPRAIASRRL